MLEKLTIWQRVVLLVIIAVLGMLFLISLTLFRLKALDQQTQILVQQVSAGRMSQRIIVRAQEIRAHLLLSQQHNPAIPEIMALHDHSLDLHLQKVANARKELEEAFSRLKQIKAGMGELVDSEEKAVLAKLETAIQRYIQDGMLPVQEQIVHGAYNEASRLIIKQIQPTYGVLKEIASDEANRIEKQGISAGEAATAQLETVNLVVISGGLLVLLVSTVASWLVAKSLGRQIGGEPQQGIRLMQQASAGHLNLQVEAPQESMLGALGSMLYGLRSMVEKIRSGVTTLRDSVSTFNHTIFSISGATESQAIATSSVAAAIEQLTVSINHIAETIHTTEQQATLSAQQAATGEKQVQQAVQLMQNVAQQLSLTSTQIRTLDTRSHEISSIAAVIKDIADQTNLLALNAAIEAARAGESGRGFAVVADEVRKLAERTSTATGDIEKMIGSIQLETAAAVNMMERALPEVGQSVELVTATRRELESILGSSQEISDQVRDVASATREQGAASTAIAQQIEQIAQSAEKTSVAVQTAAKTVMTVEQQAAVLNEAAARFQT